MDLRRFTSYYLNAIAGSTEATALSEWLSRCHTAFIDKAVDDDGNLNIKVHDEDYNKFSVPDKIKQAYPIKLRIPPPPEIPDMDDDYPCPDSIKEGINVKIKGLRGAKWLNGAEGFVLRVNRASNRLTVCMESDGNILAIKPAYAEAIPEEDMEDTHKKTKSRPPWKDKLKDASQYWQAAPAREHPLTIHDGAESASSGQTTKTLETGWAGHGYVTEQEKAEAVKQEPPEMVPPTQPPTPEKAQVLPETKTVHSTWLHGGTTPRHTNQLGSTKNHGRSRNDANLPG